MDLSKEEMFSFLYQCWWCVGYEYNTVNRDKYIKEPSRCLTDLGSLFPLLSYREPNKSVVMTFQPIITWQTFELKDLWLY